MCMPRASTSSRFASVKLTSLKCMPRASTSLRSAPVKLALRKLASINRARRRFAPVKSTSLKRTLQASASLRSAPARSSCALGLFARKRSNADLPAFRIARCSRLAIESPGSRRFVTKWMGVSPLKTGVSVARLRYRQATYLTLIANVPACVNLKATQCHVNAGPSSFAGLPDKRIAGCDLAIQIEGAGATFKELNDLVLDCLSGTGSEAGVQRFAAFPFRSFHAKESIRICDAAGSVPKKPEPLRHKRFAQNRRHG